MRALSLLNPWAWAVVHGGKRIENRTWQITYRGEFLIHAGKGWDTGLVDGIPPELYIDRAITRAGIARPYWSEVPRGAIIGKATIVACAVYNAVEHGDREWAFGPYCAELENVVPCEPFPHRGALQFFDVPLDVVEQLKFEVSV